MPWGVLTLTMTQDAAYVHQREVIISLALRL